MPVVNPLARELVFKVVYYGPGLGGKTTSLQYVHATAKPEHRGKMVSLATPVDRTLYFDFLPIRVPSVRGMSVRLQLFTVPGQVYYNATRKLVLTGADGVVLVFDSQRARFDANQESLENLVENLRAHGRELASVPHIIQYNKRDLFDVASVDELERQLNHHHATSFATTAPTGVGIYESLEAITRAVLEDFERRMPDTRGLPSTSLELPEGGLVDALRRAENGSSAPIVVTPRKSSPSGEYRLSRFPETDPGEAAARAASGQTEDVIVPKNRQTWPLPGAPDDNRRPPVVPPQAPLPTGAAPVPVPPATHATPAAAPVAATPAVATPVAPLVEPAAAQVEPAAAQVEPAVAPQSVAPPPQSVAPAPPPPPVADAVPVAAAAPQEEAAPVTEGRADISPASMREPPPRSRPPSAAPSAIPEPLPTGVLSFEPLWPQTERSTVRELEAAFAAMNYTRAITLSEQLVARSLAGAAAALGGTPDAPRDPFTVVLVLNIDRRRYLEYRALVRDARAGRTMSASEALVAYAMAIDSRLSRLSLTG
jgi:mutual gliding-motility protein MglA